MDCAIDDVYLVEEVEALIDEQSEEIYITCDDRDQFVSLARMFRDMDLEPYMYTTKQIMNGVLHGRRGILLIYKGGAFSFHHFSETDHVLAEYLYLNGWITFEENRERI